MLQDLKAQMDQVAYQYAMLQACNLVISFIRDHLEDWGQLGLQVLLD